MIRIISLAAAIALLAGCSVGIIGGADDATSIFVGRQPLESSTSSSEPQQPQDSDDESSSSQSDAQPESSQSSVPQQSSQSVPPQSSASSTVSVENNGEPVFSLSTERLKAGDMMTFTCENPPDDLEISLDLSGSHRLFMHDGVAMAFIGASRNVALGNYTLRATSGGRELATLSFAVVDAGFESESFEMAQSTVNNTVNNNAARDEYNRITAEVMATNTADDRLPELDGFIMPIDPPNFRISSSYGYTRIVNGKVSGRHEGVDFPAPQGTPVVAAAAGRVLYAGFMQMTGNTVVIEHGMGLKSWYQHLDSLDCSEGDLLEAGDPVGKVGTTGYSTGNHLHFGMSVFDIYTNPWQFIPMPQ